MFEDSDEMDTDEGSENSPMILSSDQDPAISARKKLEEYMEEQALRRELEDDFLMD